MSNIIVRTNNKRINVELVTHRERWCGMCGGDESKRKESEGEQVIHLEHGNSDTMHHTSSISLCEEHARQIVAALNAGLFEVEWNKNHEASQ